MAVIVGRNADAVADAAAKWGWAESATDWREVIAREDIDIVDIVTPGDSHAEIAIAALEAGKHVLCEKPLANTVAEAEAMADAAARAAARGIRAMVGFTYRRVPAVTFLRDLDRAGRGGPDRAGARELPAGLARRPRDAARVAPAEGARRFGCARRHRCARDRPGAVRDRDEAREGLGRHRHHREAAAAAGLGLGALGHGGRGVRRGHRRRRRDLHRALRQRSARIVRGHPVRDRTQERALDRGLGRQGRARVRPRGPQHPLVLRPHGAEPDAGLHPDPRDRGGASVRRGLVAGGPHARLRARVLAPGEGPRRRHRRRHRPPPDLRRGAAGAARARGDRAELRRRLRWVRVASTRGARRPH